MAGSLPALPMPLSQTSSKLAQVQDFFMSDHKAIVAVLKQAGIPYRLEFFVRQRKLSLYVAQQYLETVQELCADFPKFSLAQ